MPSFILGLVSEDVFWLLWSVVGYVAKRIDWKETQKGLNKNHEKENLNRL